MKNKKIDLVILVGGKGSRIKNFLNRKPKPLARFGNYVFLDLIINQFSKYCFDKIFLMAGYRGNLIKKRYHNQVINTSKVECIIEKKPLGTGGCLSLIKNKTKNDIIMVNGDSFVDIDIYKTIKATSKGSDIFLNLIENKNYKENKKLVNLNVNSTSKIFFDKNSNFINAGIYKIKNKFIKKIPKKNISIEDEIIPPLIKQKRVNGFINKGFFLDIGTEANYLFAKKNLIKNITKPAIFLDRDGTLNEDKGYTYKVKNLKFLKNVTAGLKKLSKKNIYIFIVTNQSGIGRGYFSIEEFYKFQKEMFQKLRKHKIFINDFEYCPYHPEAKIKRFRKISNLRKPNNGMVKKILKKWPVNIKKSFMVGDSVTDEMCAKKSGLKFYYTSKKFDLLCNKIIRYL